MEGKTTVEDTKNPARRGRGRRPAAEVRRNVLAATGEILFEVGLAGITFEKVAFRAGVSKTTLYKWWPSTGALALEGYFAAVEQELAFQDTGEIERDLAVQLRAFVRLLNEGGGRQVVAELIGEAQTDPDLAAAFSEYYSLPRRRLALERLSLARRRGQIRADVDLEVVVDQLWGACYKRLLIPDQPLDNDFAGDLVRNIMSGIRA